MKFLVFFAVALACASAAAVDESAAPVISSEYELQPEGNFKYSYETGNGIVAEAEGVVSNPNSENAVVAIKGSVKYTAPDGVPVELTYVANEDGYQPQGSHIPVPPPIPELIQRSLDYIAAHPPAKEVAHAVVGSSHTGKVSLYGK